MKGFEDFFEVPSQTMEPTIPKGKRLKVDKFHYQHSKPERWHIVVACLSHEFVDVLPTQVELQNPEGPSGKPQILVRPSFLFVKRVLGLPGEKIRFTASQILCNERALEIPVELRGLFTQFSAYESYKHGATDFRVPDNGLFLISDNVRIGYDSRTFGSIPIELIVGRVIL